ncbi:MAG TPA: tRNA pseudouridine(38-40) synthase TruA [Opitutaceae bacterium]
MKLSPQATRWKAVCAYDGGLFHGWQSQSNAVAVQDVIEAALERVLGVATRIHGSGRTDTGVHARAQVFHFDAFWPRDPSRLITALGTRLPHGVQVSAMKRARPGFHARFDAIGKRYQYRLFLGQADPFEVRWCWSYPKELSYEAMLAAADVLRGRHDFAAFCAQGGGERLTTARDLRRLELKRSGRRVRFILEADGFLYKMARSIVGAIVNVGRGGLSTGDLRALLHSRERIPVVFTAPAHGLCLERVFYQPGS